MPGAVAAVAVFLVEVGVPLALVTFMGNVFVYASAVYLLNRVSKALSPKTRGAGLGDGTEINYYDAGAGVRIVYGRVRTGGMETIPPVTSGENSRYLHKVLTLAGHEIDSYNFTHFDTDTIDNAAIGPVSFSNSDGCVNSGSYRNRAWIRNYRGTSTDSADRILMGVDSPAFNNSRGRGIAKSAIRLRFDSDVYQSVPDITYTYQGKRCYDPRLDVTPGASPTNTSYIAWTQNPALCLVDYLMATYGGEYTSSEIDWDTVVTAANYCDGTVDQASGTAARYTCNGVLYATDDFADNVEALVDAMLGRIIFRDGQWRIFAGSWQTPTFTIQKEDWISGLSIRFEQGRDKRFNRMKCWFVDPERDWQRVECNPRYNTTYRTADGNEDIEAETEQLLCTNESEAQRKTEFLLRQSRNQITVVGRLPPKFQKIALWETGTIVFDYLGWSSKTFRAAGIDINPDGSMDCVFSEEQSEDWTDLTSSEYNAPSTAPLPANNVTSPSEPESLAVDANNVAGTLRFTIGNPVVKPSGTQFVISRKTTATAASGEIFPGTEIWRGSSNVVDLVSPASLHYYWVTAVANSAWGPYFPTSGNNGVSGLAVGLAQVGGDYENLTLRTNQASVLVGSLHFGFGTANVDSLMVMPAFANTYNLSIWISAKVWHLVAAPHSAYSQIVVFTSSTAANGGGRDILSDRQIAPTATGDAAGSVPNQSMTLNGTVWPNEQVVVHFRNGFSGGASKISVSNVSAMLLATLY